MSAVKSKFVGILRGLLRRFDDGETDATGEVELSRPVSAAAPQISAAVPPPTDSQPTVEPVVPSVPANPNEIQLPLPPILAGLPLELRGKIMTANTAGMVISIPVDKVLPQLATGIGQNFLRRTAAPGSGRVCQFRRRTRHQAGGPAPAIK